MLCGDVQMKDFQEAERIERYRQKDRHEIGKEATGKYPRITKCPTHPSTLPGSSAPFSTYTKALFLIMSKFILTSHWKLYSAYCIHTNNTHIKYHQLYLMTALYHYDI